MAQDSFCFWKKHLCLKPFYYYQKQKGNCQKAKRKMKGTEAWDDGNKSNGDGWSSNQMWRSIHQDFYIKMKNKNL